MKTLKKLSLTLAASVSTLAGIHMLNSYIAKNSIKNNIIQRNAGNGKTYTWELSWGA